MNKDFTYQEQSNGKLETYEWDNIWWEHAECSDKKRVLIIGDSISCGYRRIVNTLLAGEFYADGLGTSKAVDNPFFEKTIDYVISQQPSQAEAVFINNGLHGWHLSYEEYAEAYEKLISFIERAYPKKKIFIILTTPTRKSSNEHVICRNAKVCEIAKNHSIETVDLYSALENAPQLYLNDGIHLTEEGYGILAERVAAKIKEALL